MGEHNWMVYGANGYTGELIAQVAKRRGLSPILAGRRADAVAAVADKLGMQHRVFDVAHPDLDGVDAVLHAAGPFSATSKPMVDACIASKTHYLDITGEISVFEACHARDADARAAGIAVMPGVGFDVVPTDCLALALKEALPSATRLQLAFKGVSRASAGTAKSAVEAMGYGGKIRENGALRTVPTAWKTRDVAFRDKSRTCVSVPWGDVSTAYYTTGIPNVIVYTYLPAGQRRMAKLARPVLPLLRVRGVQNLLKRRIERTVTGPDAQFRASDQCQLWGRVEDDAGNSVEGTLVTPEGYQLTAETSVEATLRVLDGGLSGALTPAAAFGSGFITEFERCDMNVGRRAA
jgi:short subunit dehydrogenase-like uncharacterized protein